VISNRLRMFKCAAFFEIGGNARGAEGMTAGREGEGAALALGLFLWNTSNLDMLLSLSLS
jgi:hypothetical protein